MPRTAINTEPLTFDQYLTLEERQELRHEFVDGFMFAMAGATKRHNRIASNIHTKATIASRVKPECSAYIENVKLRTPNGVGYYPDVVLTCNDDIDELVINSPCFIVEVLSPSTEDIDRGEKWLNYQKAKSLKMYVLVRQDQKFLEVYKRNSDHTWQYSILEEEGLLEFECVSLSMTLEEIYQDVPLEA